ncbi:dolichyl-phosphate-mannose--protein mannosyltransferase [Nocardioides campestrisoli]|uniref:dolichyl-phosphate-mannose--protein mannosyltransferase n=1 Tax=Nocardioides campestrisoli TaxID=2736757 RepID=UPI002811E8B7|nr:phospholipid carrier-dependent glycosyltransferase [Nocardioides campestrisoli]
MTPPGRRPRLQDPVVAWTAALLLTGVTFALRVWHLGSPRQFAFDETYYAKDAWSLLHHGYVRGYVDGADAQILEGTTGGLWKDDPSMVVHPEVGKWLIALGEQAFGMDPFGWRIASAVVGSLMVLVMCRLALRLTGSVFWGLVAGLLVSLDGLHLVLSRLALLDIFMAFFLLCGVHCVVADRQWFHARLARLAPDGVTRGWGPRVWFRPWLLLGGIAFGLAVGTKWTALYPLAAFGLLVWAWSAGARRSLGVRWPVLRAAVADGVPAFVHLVLVAFVVYVASWTGWLVHAEEYERTLSATQYSTYDGGEPWPTASEPDASGLGEVRQSLESLLSYHRDVYTFHTAFLNDATHTYSSKPGGWLLMERPVGVSVELDIPPGTDGCDAVQGSTCLRQVMLLGNPVLWWGGCLALLAALALWAGARDWRFGVPVVGVAATWLPWFQYDDRTIFVFYAIAMLPFVVLALVLCLARLVGPDLRPSRRRTLGAVVGGSFTVLVVLAFAWFWPVWTNELITHDEWLGRMWFRRWI